MGRGPHRQPDLDRLRPRLPHARRAGAQGREDDRPAGARCSPTRARSTPTRSRRSSGPGLFHIVTGSYDIPAAHVVADGAYTNKAPGGVAYRCSFRVTEASYLIERLVDNAAHELGVDPAAASGSTTSSSRSSSRTSRRPGSSTTPATTRRRCDIALEKLGYEELRREQEEARAEGRLLGIGIASFTEVVGAGHGKDYDIAGLRMFDSAELRVHPTGKAILKLGVKSQGQGHETTFAQIVAEELGIPSEDVEVQEGDTDNTPYGLGTYASRSTPVAGAADDRHLPQAARQGAGDRRAPARGVGGGHRVRGGPLLREGLARAGRRRSRTCAFAAYTNLPEGMEAGLEGVTLLRPAEHDLPVRHVRGRGRDRPRHGRSGSRVKVVAVDDCGVRINPMIVEGQIMGGLTEGYAIAAMQLIDFDEDGNCIGSNFMDYLHPDRLGDARVRARRDSSTPSPHHPIGAKGVGESPTVGLPGRVRERGDRRALARRREEHRHAAHARQGVGGAAAGRDRRVTDPSQRLDRGAVLVEAGRLAAEGRPFVLATVVSRPAAGLGADRRPRHRDGGREARRLGRRRLLRAGGRPRGAPRARRGRRPACSASARREAPKEGRASSWPRARARRRGWSRC